MHKHDKWNIGRYKEEKVGGQKSKEQGGPTRNKGTREDTKPWKKVAWKPDMMVFVSSPEEGTRYTRGHSGKEIG